VTVTTAGVTSFPASFTIIPAGGLPIVLSLSPINATAGGAGFTLTVSGADFVSGSRVLWNGAVRMTSFVSSTELQVNILATDIAKEGTYLVSVANPAPNAATSAAQPLAVISSIPVPTITGASIPDAVDGSDIHLLSLTGMDFVPGATVKWNGAGLATTYVSPWQIMATLPAVDFGSEATVTVVNPVPGGTSAGFTLP
jgi:hypothetical protein